MVFELCYLTSPATTRNIRSREEGMMQRMKEKKWVDNHTETHAPTPTTTLTHTREEEILWHLYCKKKKKKKKEHSLVMS
jgi:hypothetical protein